MDCWDETEAENSGSVRSDDGPGDVEPLEARGHDRLEDVKPLPRQDPMVEPPLLGRRQVEIVQFEGCSPAAWTEVRILE